MLESSPNIGLLFPSQNICWQKTLATFVKELLRKCKLMVLHTRLVLVTIQSGESGHQTKWASMNMDLSKATNRALIERKSGL
eukprot:3128440-Heterocapsa_arctica.AAC.1